MSRSEFDEYAESYELLLRDPIRDRFGGGASFFQERKRDLIRAYWRRHGKATRTMRYLDVGCGKGELLTLLRDDFASVAGCDPSAEMLGTAEKIEMRVQPDVGRIPYEDGEFDFVTAVCVYHHVPVAERQSLSREVRRIMKPGGVFAIIEHNPYNPVTRTIVRRTPVDANAILLRRRECSEILQASGFTPQEFQYFLYFPESIYRRTGDACERILGKLPLGGQYAEFAIKTDSGAQ
jgi:SAM-dependent methyltransferase